MSDYVEHFEDFCGSDSLSLVEMHRMTEGVSLDDLQNSTFLHITCMNKRVTKEIIEYLVELYPSAVNFCLDIPDELISSAYPLHLACYNPDFPAEVIHLLMDRSDSDSEALSHLCVFEFEWANDGYDDDVSGLPLHYYLARTSNVHLDTVKRLLNANMGAVNVRRRNTWHANPYHSA